MCVFRHSLAHTCTAARAHTKASSPAPPSPTPSSEPAISAAIPASPSHKISIATGPGERPETGTSAAPSCTGSAHTGSLPAETAILPAPAPQDIHAQACAPAPKHQWPWEWPAPCTCTYRMVPSPQAAPRPPHAHFTCRHARHVSRRVDVHARTRVCVRGKCARVCVPQASRTGLSASTNTEYSSRSEPLLSAQPCAATLSPHCESRAPPQPARRVCRRRGAQSIPAPGT